MIATRLFLSAAPLLAIAISSARADAPSFVGQWHWNKAQSTAVTGEAAPSDILLDIEEASGGKLKWTVTETDPSGAKHVEKFDGVPDGKPTPLMGGGGGGATAAFTMADGALKAVFANPSGGSDSWTCVVTPDRRKMKCKGVESDGKGHSEDYADVYDRG